MSISTLGYALLTLLARGLLSGYDLALRQNSTLTSWHRRSPFSPSLMDISDYGATSMRGNPYVLPGTYLNSVYESLPLPYVEGGYGYPESRQTVINVTNGKLMRLLVDDEPFDVRYGVVQEHKRVLDFRDGVLRRSVGWTSPTGRTIKVSSVRMVSFTQRAIAAISYEVEPLDAPVSVVVQSELVANEALPDLGGDPRVSAVPESPLVSEEHLAENTAGLLVHHTRASGLRIGAAMDHRVEGPPRTIIESQSPPISPVYSSPHS